MRRINIIILMSLMLTIQTVVNSESIFDWFWKKPTGSVVVSDDGVPLVSIPYESMTDDEKFLHQATKFTELEMNSPLEVCLHNVIIKIKTSCNSMSEEELAKLSVHLLNCQSVAEGRRTYPCNEEMTIKDCTSDMDTDTWNTYHLMSNRARAVCYSVRSLQFRALSELSVNKLMHSVHTQIGALNKLKDSQKELQKITSSGLDLLREKNDNLLEKQTFLQDAQIMSQHIVSSNLRDLNKEKVMIRSCHAQIVSMTNDIKIQLGKVNEKFQEYSENHEMRHLEILKNLTNIHNQAQELLTKIEKSADEYEKNLQKLKQINTSINFIWDIIQKMRTEVDNKLKWITYYLGNKEEHIITIYHASTHAFYLICSMVLAAFLHAPTLTRVTIISIIPLNFVTYWKYGPDSCLDLISITLLISSITAIHYFIEILKYFFKPKVHTIQNVEEDNNFLNKKIQSKKFTYKKASLLQRLHNEFNILRRFLTKMRNYLKEKLKHYFCLTIQNLKGMFGREMLIRSCSYISAAKACDSIVDSTVDVNDVDDSFLNMSDSMNNKIICDDYIRHRMRNDNEISQNEYEYEQPISNRGSYLRPKRKHCSSITKSGNLCRDAPIKGYKYCSKHL